MHQALDMQRLDVVEAVIKWGPKELLYEECEDILPLTRAMQIGLEKGDIDYSLAEALLGHGVNPNLGGGLIGETPLHLAASRGAVNGVKLLLHFGADPDVRNCQQFTPLHTVCAAHSLPCVNWLHTEIVKLLLSRDADPTLLDMSGKRPEAYCTEYAQDMKHHLLEATFSMMRVRLLLALGRGGDDSFPILPMHLVDVIARCM
jgi:ankyrin repeat protein